MIPKLRPAIYRREKAARCRNEKPVPVQKARLTMVAIKAAAMAGARTTLEKLRCSSQANMTPARAR